MSDDVVLRLTDATVRYGATVALDGVDLELRAGEVHALVGENGAGKSTLLRLITGIVTPERGALWMAPRAKLAWAPQEPVLAPDLTAAEWIFLAREEHGALGFLRQRTMQREAEHALREVGCGVPAGTHLGELPAAQRKQVQLARALHGAPDLLLLDEPTAALGTAEAERLFDVVRRRRAAGSAVLYVTHRLDEVRALADRVTVLRDGHRVSTDAVGAVDTATIVQRMVGRDLMRHARRSRSPGEILLQVEDLSVAQVEGARLEVRRGEIVGLAGLVGAGRSEILEALAGVRRARRGNVVLHASPVFVPEDRGGNGLIPTFCLRENVFLPAPSAWLDIAGERVETSRWIAELSIRGGGPEAPIDSLSGGNQQKLLLARALRQRPALLLLDEPTAGVDVGAKAEIHALVQRLAEAGTAILLSSSDLPELLGLCDRIVALRDGGITGELSTEMASESRLGALITGTAASAG